MKKFLALILALTMVASGSVLALAEETAGDAATGGTPTGTTEETTEPTTPGEGTETPAPDDGTADDTTTPGDSTTTPGDDTTPNDPVETEPSITLDNVEPNGEVRMTWSVYSPSGTHGILAKTKAGVKLVDYSHTNTADLTFYDDVEDDTTVWLRVELNNTDLTQEDVGKSIKDTITVILDNGETHSFTLTITYRGGAMVRTKSGNRGKFIEGQTTSFVMTILDPEGTFPLPYQVQIVQEKASGDALEENLLEIQEIKQDGMDFTVTVKAIRTGYAHLHIYVIDADGRWYGQGQPMEVSADGTYRTSQSVKDRTESESKTAQDAAVDVIEAANEAIAKGEAMPSKVQTVTTASGASAPVVSAKLYGLNATLSLSTMETLAGSTVGLRADLDNGAAEVVIPGGFQMPTGTGVLAYSLGYQNEPLYTNLMRDAVGDEKAQVCRLGGGVLPTDATITLKTKLTGQVNVYYWNEDTRRLTLIASPTAQGGKVTFASRQLGNLIITPNKI